MRQKAVTKKIGNRDIFIALKYRKEGPVKMEQHGVYGSAGIMEQPYSVLGGGRAQYTGTGGHAVRFMFPEKGRKQGA
jgi:hypothetical protein